MAFLQSDLPPSTASVAPVGSMQARALSVPAGFRHARLVSRLAFAIVVTAVLSLLGIAAARATESFAVGIIAADLVFLLGVAGWSALFVGARR